MIPFGDQTVTLYHKGDQGYTRHILTGCSWRSTHGSRMYDNVLQADGTTTCSCRYPHTQQRAAEGDIFVLGTAQDTLTSGTQIAGMLAKYRDRGIFVCTAFADNALGGHPMPHYHARGEVDGL